MRVEPQRPENEFKAGAVRASIWSNLRKTGDGNFFNSRKVVLERIYKDSQGNFKTTNSLDINDIPKAMLVLQMAYKHLILANRKTETIKNDNPWATEEAVITT